MAVANLRELDSALLVPMCTLYIAPRADEHHARIRGVLEETGISFEEPHTGILAIDLESHTLEHLGVEIGHCTNASALHDCPALILGSGVEPSLQDLARTQPLGVLLAAAQHGWLTDVITQGRLTSYFQPIVSMEDPTTVYAYECLLRGHQPDGRLISPTRIFEGARVAGWLPEIDRIARATAMRCAVQQGIDTPVFINLLPNTITSPGHHLATIGQELDAARLPRSQVVFEIVETERVEEVHLLQRIVAEYRKAGFGIALDDVGAGYNSLNLVARLKPDLIKLDMELVRDVHRDPYKGEIASKLLEAAQNLGVRTIAEGIETEDEWFWLLRHGAEYGQGYAFAKPAPVPPMPRVPVGSYLHGSF